MKKYKLNFEMVPERAYAGAVGRGAVRRLFPRGREVHDLRREEFSPRSP